MSAAIELEIFRHLFASIAEEMGVRLQRSAYSPNIKERRDFSCALFDADGEMIAQAAHIPVHLGSTPMSVQAVLDVFPPKDMHAEDRFVVNDPFAGGTHLPDITVVAPCLLPHESTPRFFVANRAHHADVGGKTAGSMPMSTHIDEEGVRIPPSRLDAKKMAWICAQTRTPDERHGDLQAQMAALNAGLARLHALSERYPPAIITQRANDLQAYSERLMRAVLRTLPQGTFSFTDFLDDDGFGTTDIALTCHLTLSGETATVDFRDSADQVRGPMNAVRAIAVSAVNYVFRCLADESLPVNSGLMRPIHVLTRPGSVVDALPPAAVAGGNVETSQRLVDVLFGALAQAVPDRIPAASCGTMNNLTIGSLPDDPHSFAYYETIAGGAGASPDGPGGSGVHTHMTNTLNTPVEALEHAYPFRITAYQIRTGSGGAGHHRGGAGVLRRYTFDRPAEVTVLTERRIRGPYGLQGGHAGTSGKNTWQNDTATHDLGGKKTLSVTPSDTLEIATPGGGGWGQP